MFLILQNVPFFSCQPLFLWVGNQIGTFFALFFLLPWQRQGKPREENKASRQGWRSGRLYQIQESVV